MNDQDKLPNGRTCQLPGCGVALVGNQQLYCCKKHKNAARFVEKPETLVSVSTLDPDDAVRLDQVMQQVDPETGKTWEEQKELAVAKLAAQGVQWAVIRSDAARLRRPVPAGGAGAPSAAPAPVSLTLDQTQIAELLATYGFPTLVTAWGDPDLDLLDAMAEILKHSNALYDMGMLYLETHPESRIYDKTKPDDARVLFVTTVKGDEHSRVHLVGHYDRCPHLTHKGKGVCTCVPMWVPTEKKGEKFSLTPDVPVSEPTDDELEKYGSGAAPTPASAGEYQPPDFDTLVAAVEQTPEPVPFSPEQIKGVMASLGLELHKVWAADSQMLGIRSGVETFDIEEGIRTGWSYGVNRHVFTPEGRQAFMDKLAAAGLLCSWEDLESLAVRVGGWQG